MKCEQHCRCCENGELWAECCNGADRCPCKGQQVYLGKCQVCNGTGIEPEHANRNANLRFIRAIGTTGYLGNPFGRLR